MLRGVSPDGGLSRNQDLLDKEPMSSFESPLLITRQTEFTAIKFGTVVLIPPVARLRDQLNDLLYETASELPAPLASQAHGILRGYSGGDRNFYSLFYVPVWSFLHWAPAAVAVPLNPDVLGAARLAHAMSLFLHLWDDHLCDGQLQVDLLRLQFRTLAWKRFTEASYRVCELTGISTEVVDEHIAQYLTSHDKAQPSLDLDEYCSGFSHQFAICTLAPRLLGRCPDQASSPDELYQAVNHFAISWRLLDDIQDVHLDVMLDKETAVWIELDEVGRAKWTRCHALSTATGKLDTEAWKELCSAIRDSGCMARLLSRLDQELLTAAEIAHCNNWAGLAGELEQSRTGIAKL